MHTLIGFSSLIAILVLPIGLVWLVVALIKHRGKKKPGTILVVVFGTLIFAFTLSIISTPNASLIPERSKSANINSPPLPKTPQEQIQLLMEDMFSGETNMGEHRLKAVTITACGGEGKEIIDGTHNIRVDFRTGSNPKPEQIMNAALEAQEQLWNAERLNKTCIVTIDGYMPLIDPYGKPFDGRVFGLWLTDDAAKSINWENKSYINPREMGGEGGFFFHPKFFPTNPYYESP